MEKINLNLENCRYELCEILFEYRENGNRKILLRNLRKTFGYNLHQQTEDEVTTQQILNHFTPQVTLRYIGITQDIKDSTIRKLSFKR